jgi:hypothetical protein
VLMLAASGVPSPLYRVYQQEFGFSSGVMTTVFGIYSIALLASLLVVGGLSDHVRWRCSCWRTASAGCSPPASSRAWRPER